MIASTAANQAAVVLTWAAYACLTVALVLDLRAAWQADRQALEGPPPSVHPGLAWIRSGVLGLWASVVVRIAGNSFSFDGLAWEILPALGYTAILHLFHVQNWKGVRLRRTGIGCWVLVLTALLANLLFPVSGP